VRKPKLLFYFSILALILSLLTFYVSVLGLALAILALILSHNELKQNLVNTYDLREIKSLKIAKRLSIVSVIVAAFIFLFDISIIVFTIIAYFSH